MNRKSLILALLFGAFAMVMAGCPKKQQKKESLGKRQTTNIRGRADDAFADLDAAERGDPTPPPKARPKLDEEEMKPKPKPPPPPPKIKKKPPEAVPVNPARAAPAWVNSQPNMPGYYVGIGVSTNHGDESRDWASARNHAYTELASTLKVHINSVITDYFKENNLKLYEGDNVTKNNTRQDSSYGQDTQFFVDQTLEGVEIHDRWKDVGQVKYWMLVRLSKAEIARRIRERLEKARKKALDHVQAAIKAEGTGRIGMAFMGYFKSYLALREYFGGVVEYDVNRDGKLDVLNHEIERAVHRLAGDLEWQVASAKWKAVNGQGLDEPLAVTVAYKGNPVKSLPVAFAFQRGKGSVEGRVSTGADGVANAKVVKIFGDKQAILGARVDVTALTDNSREAKIVEAKFGNSIDLKTGKFFVELEELSAFISIEETLLGEEVKPGTIASDIKERLHADLGLVFTGSARGADMEIKGTAVVDECTDFYDQRRCVARVVITVADRLKNRQLFSKKYKVSGNGESDVEAGRNALRKAGKKIAKKLVVGMK